MEATVISGKNYTAKELIQITESYKPSGNLTEDDKRVEDIAAKVGAYVRLFTGDVNRYWFSEKSDSKSVAKEWVVEAAEHMGEFVKEGRKKGIDKTDDIGKELVDTLYFLLKYIDVKKIDIEKEWCLSIKNAHEALGQGVSLYQGFNLFSSAEIADAIFEYADEIYRTERYEWEKSFRGHEGPTAAATLHSIFKIAEKRGIDLESVWQKKMKASKEKHDSEYGLS